ncbi:hypothetical protein, partial [Streptococcus pneumoniae]|uniref:hypothetical protein n=1 Tax=Streptococcus pneumoniae TaxID=1313 RepID=UPI0018B07CE1
VLGYGTVGYVGHAGYVGLAANSFAGGNQYVVMQNATNGDAFFNAPTGRAIYTRIQNANVYVTDATGIEFAAGKNIGTN